MARASDPIDRFGRFLAQSEHSPLTIKNYRSDLAAFAAWFEERQRRADGAGQDHADGPEAIQALAGRAAAAQAQHRQSQARHAEELPDLGDPRRGSPLAFPSQLRAKPGAVPGPFPRSGPGRDGWTAASRTPCCAPSNARAGHETWRSSGSCSTPGCGSRNCAT